MGAKDCSKDFVGDEAPTFCLTTVESYVIGYDQEDFSGFRETRACGSSKFTGRENLCDVMGTGCHTYIEGINYENYGIEQTKWICCCDTDFCNNAEFGSGCGSLCPSMLILVVFI